MNMPAIPHQHRPEAGYVDRNLQRAEDTERMLCRAVKQADTTFVQLVLSTVLNVCLAAAVVYMLVTK